MILAIDMWSSSLVFDKRTAQVIGFAELNHLELEENWTWSDRPKAAHILALIVRVLLTGLKFLYAHFLTKSLFWRWPIFNCVGSNWTFEEDWIQSSCCHSWWGFTKQEILSYALQYWTHYTQNPQSICKGEVNDLLLFWCATLDEDHKKLLDAFQYNGTRNLWVREGYLLLFGGYYVDLHRIMDKIYSGNN